MSLSFRQPAAASPHAPTYPYYGGRHASSHFRVIERPPMKHFAALRCRLSLTLSLRRGHCLSDSRSILRDIPARFRRFDFLDADDYFRQAYFDEHSIAKIVGFGYFGILFHFIFLIFDF
jgi:hypothetical protein